MKILRRASLVVPVFALALASTAFPEGNKAKSSMELEVREDVARWNALPLVQLEYQQPPEGWHRVDNDIFRISFFMPCKPELKRVTKEGQAAFRYLCAIDGRQYSLFAFPATDLHVPEFRDEFFWSLAKGWLRQTAELGMPGSLEPKSRVFYQGAIGRQAILSMGPAQIEKRQLPGSNAMISMQVLDLPNKQPGDSTRYFNSLKFF